MKRVSDRIEAEREEAVHLYEAARLRRDFDGADYHLTLAAVYHRALQRLEEGEGLEESRRSVLELLEG